MYESPVLGSRDTSAGTLHPSVLGSRDTSAGTLHPSVLGSRDTSAGTLHPSVLGSRTHEWQVLPPVLDSRLLARASTCTSLEDLLRVSTSQVLYERRYLSAVLGSWTLRVIGLLLACDLLSGPWAPTPHPPSDARGY
jgi:hypothetical protein